MVTSSLNREGLESHLHTYMNQCPGTVGTERTGSVVHVTLLLSWASVYHTLSSALYKVDVHWAGYCFLWIDTDHYPGLALLKSWC